jgi:hypoxanthine phosphoribosyltransferase
MYNLNIIDNKTYFEDVNSLILKLNKDIIQFDCIFAIKRSGLIIGSILSNQYDIPLITSDIKEIPDKFKNILIVDDKVCTGKTIKKYINCFYKKELKFKTACLYLEGDILTNYYVKNLNNTIYKMWYEIKTV